MTTDFTKGSPLKQIFLFSIPFLIGNLFQQFYNIADMVIVGRALDPAAYGAVGSTGSLVWFASGAIQALTTGFSVVTARCFGAQDDEGVKRRFAVSIKLSAIISVLMALVCTLFARPFLEFMRTPDDIMERAYGYIVWVFAGLVATALFNLLSNMIRALGDSRTPLYFLVIACIINIALDFFLIVVCGMDTDGAGLATVLAQLISGLLCIGYIVKKQPRLHISAKYFKFDLALDRLLLQVGLPMAFLNMVLSVGSIVMQFVTNGMGTLYVTSQTTGAKLESFVTQPLLSFGSSVAVFAAQNYGAKQYGRVIAGGRKTILMGMVWCVIASLIMVPFGRFFVTLLAGDVEQTIIENGYRYILINTLLSFVLVPLIVYKSILQSVGRTSWCMVSGFTEIIGRAGLSLVVIALMNGALTAVSLDEQSAFTLMCFCSPLAWLFGFLTVWGDYIFMVRKFKKLEKTKPENEQTTQKGLA